MRGVAVAGLLVAACGGGGDKVVIEPLPPPEVPPFDVHWVREAAELETLALGGDEEAVAGLRESMGEAIGDSDFALYVDPETPAEGLPTIGGTAVIAVVRVGDGDEPSCATTTTLRGGGGRDAFRVSTEGVCGGISVLHSLLDLGLVQPGQVIRDGKFTKGAIDGAQGPNKKGMTPDTLVDQHRRGGTGNCRIYSRGDGIATNSRAFGTFLDWLTQQMAQDPRRDCTLSVFSRQNGRVVLSHFEHVKSATKSGNTTTITTTNGLDQGGPGRASVPADPGTNTWTAQPGGMRLSGSTHPDGDRYTRAIPPVQNATAICCAAPR